jgi:hypothetical protein
VLPASATGTHKPPVCPEDGVPAGDGREPAELGDCVGLGGDELGGPELPDAELGDGDGEVTRGVTANGSMAMAALLAAAG